MNINGMEISWGEILWCDDCVEIMNWDRDSHYWTCPACENSVLGKDLLEEEQLEIIFWEG